MSPEQILLFVVVVVLVWIGLKFATPRGTAIDPTDPLWAEAVARARATADTMRELVAAGHEVWVKFPYPPEAADREHFWGTVTEVADGHVVCAVETSPIRGPAPDGSVRVALADLEDWQVELEDGTIRGGFTTRAQARMAERDGRTVPDHVRDMLARMKN